MLPIFRVQAFLPLRAEPWFSHDRLFVTSRIAYVCSLKTDDQFALSTIPSLPPLPW